ncbi:hypothetical protein ABE438_18290 [Bosea sp. TWI1241]|uniref:hypothetical protein n=1 Tax=Bosea sp. TWI1241 TaxID=3148904 RepID=UPI003208F1F0
MVQSLGLRKPGLATIASRQRSKRRCVSLTSESPRSTGMAFWCEAKVKLRAI